MDMSPGATNQPTGQKEFTLSQNRISTLLSAPSTNSNSGSRPGETRFRVVKMHKKGQLTDSHASGIYKPKKQSEPKYNMHSISILL